MTCLMCNNCNDSSHNTSQNTSQNASHDTSHCDPGFYGDVCHLTCSSQCRRVACSACICEVCNRTSGSCANGCVSGWYGVTCGLRCPENCHRQPKEASPEKDKYYVTCDRLEGSCLNGCKLGFHGNQCNEACSNVCSVAGCKQDSGECILQVRRCNDGSTGGPCDEDDVDFGHSEIAGAAGGAFVVCVWAVIVIILICFIWKRRMKNHAVFHRNSSLRSSNGSRRSSRRRSSRRRRTESNSSGVNDTPVIMYTDELFGETEQYLTDNFRRYSSRRHRERDEHVTFEDEYPYTGRVHCACAHADPDGTDIFLDIDENDGACASNSRLAFLTDIGNDESVCRPKNGACPSSVHLPFLTDGEEENISLCRPKSGAFLSKSQQQLFTNFEENNTQRMPKNGAGSCMTSRLDSSAGIEGKKTLARPDSLSLLEFDKVTRI